MLSTRTVTVTSSTGVSVIGSTAVPGAGRGMARIAAAGSPPPSHTTSRLSSGGRLAARREHRAIVLVTGVRVEDLCDRTHLLWNEFSAEGVELVGSAGGKYQPVHRLPFGS